MIYYNAIISDDGGGRSSIGCWSNGQISATWTPPKCVYTMYIYIISVCCLVPCNNTRLERAREIDSFGSMVFLCMRVYILPECVYTWMITLWISSKKRPCRDPVKLKNPDINMWQFGWQAISRRSSLEEENRSNMIPVHYLLYVCCTGRGRIGSTDWTEIDCSPNVLNIVTKSSGHTTS